MLCQAGADKYFAYILPGEVNKKKHWWFRAPYRWDGHYPHPIFVQLQKQEETWKNGNTNFDLPGVWSLLIFNFFASVISKFMPISMFL